MAPVPDLPTAARASRRAAFRRSAGVLQDESWQGRSGTPIRSGQAFSSSVRASGIAHAPGGRAMLNARRAATARDRMRNVGAQKKGRGSLPALTLLDLGADTSCAPATMLGLEIKLWRGGSCVDGSRRRQGQGSRCPSWPRSKFPERRKQGRRSSVGSRRNSVASSRHRG